ncbi:MAG TPA: class I SAM-dependent methyltransferase [Anaerolineales bacterium]|nr:class I SAM-dependent methyltransferase [Anaerolineales bacterium]
MQNLFRRLLFHYWYFGQPPWDTGVSPPELLEFLQKHKPGRVIDIGCGTGTNVITLARAGWRVTGVDFAPRAIKLAKQKLAQAGVRAELSVRDATKLEGIDGPFDFAFDLGCFHTIPHPGKTKYLEQLDRILAPNGFWLMYGFLKSETPDTRPGLTQAEISLLASRLTLLSRQDGYDQRERISAWFLFQKGKQVQN